MSKDKFSRKNIHYNYIKANLPVNQWLCKKIEMKYIAQKGEIPKIGETWIPVGRKIHLIQLCLFNADQVKQLVTKELSIVRIAPNRTLGAIFLSSYGPESTLEYDEFIVAPATVRYKHRKGYWVTHMYVNNEKAMWGGRILGWPKEMANFDWPDLLPGKAAVMKDSDHICTISGLNFTPPQCLMIRSCVTGSDLRRISVFVE